MLIATCDHPIFVVGAPRSGTSMMQWALRQHPKLWGGQESDFLAPLMQALREAHDYGSQRGRLHWLSGQSVDFEEFAGFVGVGINAMYTNRAGDRRWVEQTPYYTLLMDDIVRLFPGAKFVMMVRDGRQVVHSLRNFVVPMSHEDACRTWKEYVAAGEAFRRTLGEQRVLPVRYDRVVVETASAFREIYEFLDEPFTTSSVEFIRDRKPINSSFDQQATIDPNAPRWLAWTEAEKRHFVEVAGDWLIELGFEENHAWSSGTSHDPAPITGEVTT